MREVSSRRRHSEEPAFWPDRTAANAGARKLENACYLKIIPPRLLTGSRRYSSSVHNCRLTAGCLSGRRSAVVARVPSRTLG